MPQATVKKGKGAPGGPPSGTSAPGVAPTQSPAASLPKKDPLDLTIHVQPPEFFEGEKGNLSSLATVGRFCIAISEESGLQNIAVFDQTGARAQGIKLINRWSSADLAGLLARNNESCVYPAHPREQGNQGPRFDERWLKAAGIPEFNLEPIRAKLREIPSQRDGSGYDSIRCSTLVEAKKLLFDTNFEVLSDPNDRALLFRSKDGGITVFEVQKDGAPLAPKDWVKSDFAPGTKIDPSALKDKPYLKQVLAASGPRPIGNGNLQIETERGFVKIANGADGKLLFSDKAQKYLVPPDGSSAIYYVSGDGTEVRSVNTESLKGVQTDVRSQKLSSGGAIRDIRFDRNGNYFVARIEDQGKFRLDILERETLRVAGSIPEVGEHFDLDADGNIAFSDSSGHLRLALTNIGDIPQGGVSKVRAERIAGLSEIGAIIEESGLPRVPRSKRGDASNTDLTESGALEVAQSRLRDLVQPELEGASTLERLSELRERLDALRRDPSFGDYPEVFSPVDLAIAAKAETIKIARFRESLASFSADIAEHDTPGEVVRLERNFRDLTRGRRDLVISDTKERAAVDQELAKVRSQVEQAQAKVRTEIETTLSQNLAEIEALLKAAMTLPEVNLAEGDRAALEFSEGLSLLLKAEDRQLWNRKYSQAVANRRAEIQAELDREADLEREKLAQTLEESGKIIGEITDSLAPIQTGADLLAFRRTSPLFKKLEDKLAGLREEVRRSELQKVEALFSMRAKRLDGKKSMAVGKAEGVVSFGDATFPVFEEPPLAWQPKIEPLNHGSGLGRLYFVSTTGLRFEPGADPVPIATDDAKTKAAIDASRSAAQKFFEAEKRKPPAFHDRWVVNDFTRAQLSRLARLFRTQLREQDGILILEGERGTGKNVLLDMFGHFTNREVYTFSCNYQTEKEDIAYAFRFDPQKGTYQVDAEFIRRLQTPGAVIVLDELNALPTGVAKMLNSLFDYRRCLMLPDGRVIKADPSVVLVGAMNPQYYLGVKPLAQEIISRARIVPIDYPPEKFPKGSKLTPYEAEMLSQSIPSLTALPQTDFYALWDFYVNKDGNARGKTLATADFEKSLSALAQIVRTANRIREAHASYRRGDSNDAMEFVFSMREGVQIIGWLSETPNVKEAIKEVILPKIADPDEKKRVEAIISAQ